MIEKTNGDKGFIWIPMLVFLGIFAMLMVFRTEASRMFWVRGQYVTAVDAAALAGASTADTIPLDGSGTITDENGDLVLDENVSKWKTVVNKDAADPEGLQTALLNTSHVDGHWQSGVNEDIYTFSVSGMRFKSRLETLLGKEIYLSATGEAKAIPKP